MRYWPTSDTVFSTGSAPSPKSPVKLKAAKNAAKKNPKKTPVSTADAAQKKVWKAELRDHKRAAKKVRADADRECRRLIKEMDKLERRREVVHNTARCSLADIQRRIQILEGRIGL